MSRHSINHGATALQAAPLASWRDDAACWGRADLMDPPPELAPVYEPVALALCGGCPVLTECCAWLSGLTEYGDPGGVAGGMTERDRTLRRRRGRQKKPRPAVGPTSTKRCPGCGLTKHLSDFHSDPTCLDGVTARCRACRNQRMRERARARAAREAG